MSKKVSFCNKNALSLLMLLTIFMIASGFHKHDDAEVNERKLRKEIVETASQYIGTKYKAGGKTPRGFDCSGFTAFVMKKNNIRLGASSRDQALQGEPVKINKLEKGDLVYFASKARVNHVGIVTDVGRKSLHMIHASSSRGIIEEDIFASEYWSKRLKGGRRVIP